MLSRDIWGVMVVYLPLVGFAVWKVWTNGDPWSAVMIGGFLVAVFVLALVGVRFVGERRRKVVSRVATDLGFSFAPTAVDVLDREFHALPLFHRRGGEICNVLRKDVQGTTVALMEHSFHAGERSGNIYSHTVIAFHLPPMERLPDFELCPETLELRLRSLFWGRKIRFDTHRKFSRKLRLRGPDETAIRKLFRPEVLDFFEKETNWNVETHGRWLLLYRPLQLGGFQGLEWRVKPENYPEYLKAATQVLITLIPKLPETEQTSESPQRNDGEDRILTASAPVLRSEEIESKLVVEPTTIQVGSRNVTFDTSPLPGGSPGNRIRRGGIIPPVVHTDANSLVIGIGVRGYGCLLMTVPLGTALTLLFGAAAMLPNLRPRLIPLVGGMFPTWLCVVLMILSLLWLLFWNLLGSIRSLCGECRVRFDRSSGLMTFGPVWSPQCRQLTDIVAVQVLKEMIPFEPGSPVPETTQLLERSPDGKHFYRSLYQMNLILDDRETPRLNVAVERDQTLARHVARQLTEFLGIPLIDHIRETSPPLPRQVCQ